MIDEIQKEIHRFWTEKGVEPNALILGKSVLCEIFSTYDLKVSAYDQVKYVCGLPVLSIDYCDLKLIRPVLI